MFVHRKLQSLNEVGELSDVIRYEILRLFTSLLKHYQVKYLVGVIRL